ncbi:MAG: hypothetical protein ACD_79C00135G0003 [uncultured bacterium]|nr:MAG: hypothetical protein ACD_79C00135G0003 [uncultured bacterium]
MNIRKTKAGFSLIEILVSLVVISIFSVALYAAIKYFSMTYRINTMETMALKYAETAVQNITKDICWAINIDTAYAPSLGFPNTKTSASFKLPAIDSNLEIIGNLGEYNDYLHLYIDADNKLIIKIWSDYALNPAGKTSQRRQEIVPYEIIASEHIKSINFFNSESRSLSDLSILELSEMKSVIVEVTSFVKSNKLKTTKDEITKTIRTQIAFRNKI